MEQKIIPREVLGIDQVKYLLAVLRRRWFVWLSSFLLLSLVSGVGISMKEPSYSASATLILEPESSSENSNQSQSSYKEFVNTQLVFMTSYQVMEAIPKAEILKNNPVFQEPGESPNKLKNRFLVQHQRDANLVTVSAKHWNPELARDLANTMVDVYLEQYNQDQTAASDDTFGWLSQKAEEMRKKLERSETALLEYKKEEGLISLEKRQTMLEERLLETNAEYARVANERVALESQLHQLKRVVGDPSSQASLPDALNSPLIERLKQERYNFVLQQAEYMEKYKPQHPKLQAIASQLEVVHSRLNKELKTIVASLELKAVSSREHEKRIENHLKEMDAESRLLARDAVQYGSLLSQSENNRRMYEVLLLKMEQADVSGHQDLRNVRILDKARLPTKMLGPSRQTLSLGIGFVIVILSFLICLSADFLDDRVRNEDDVKHRLNLQVFGKIPKLDPKERKEEKKEAWQRSYQECGTLLEHHMRKSPLKTLLLTSAVPGEGKTTSALQLAKAFARAGRRVLLVDADLYKGQLSTQLEAPLDKGFTETINFQSQPGNLAKKLEPNLQFLPLGVRPSDPGQTLGSENFKFALSILKEECDLLILDGPPLSAGPEVAVAASFAHGTLFVIQSGKTPCARLQKCCEVLAEARVHLIGSILNNIRSRKSYDYNYYPKTNNIDSPGPGEAAHTQTQI